MSLLVNVRSIMLPLLSLHALVAHRGDGLRPELRALLLSRARCSAGLSATIEIENDKTSASPPESIPEPEASKNP
ncbi:hypothetical protein E1956_24200 [Paraburkholderia pallida]|uniref:Uncharacterized protein n=1 Tax=Paraburkholderia pallida TaxID=2547399 RepID=A0A4P7CVL3_9BURK|nr:hypothetical protein E1956_24200 [Paraburkholderia pallida]